MDELGNLSAFLKVVERGSLTSAAAALHCSASTISKRLKQLEHSVGATLLNRSTHGRAYPTEAGRAYFDQVRTIVRELENARESVRSVNETLEGQLRVHLTPGTGQMVLMPLIFRFMREHPALRIMVSIRPDGHDVLHRGFDLSIHSKDAKEGEIGYTSIEARELVKVDYVICAAPAYLAARGTPARPEDLSDHNCLVSVRQASPHQWWFRRDGFEYPVNVSGTLEADNWTTAFEAALEGLGIVRMMRIGDLSHPTASALVPIFTDDVVSGRSIWALMHRMEPTPRKIEAFCNFLRTELQGQRTRQD